MPFGRVVFDEPVAAMDLKVFVEHEIEHLAAGDLGNRLFDCIFFERHERSRSVGRIVRRGPDPCVDQPSGPVEQALECVRADDHLADLVANRSEGGNRLSELLPIGRVPGRLANRALRAAAAHRAQLESPEIQHVEGDLVALADLAEDICRRNLHVL